MDLAKADPPAESNPEQDLLRKEKFGLIKEALGRLTEEQREVLIMSRYQDLPYREIARILKCREGTVKARVFRAVEKLRLVCRQLEGR
jgi:RNA polymerase sigma-70 factor (ECF subfamily)